VKALLLLVAAAAALSLTGCGTVCNLAGGMIHPDEEPRVYGGVLRDFEVIGAVVTGSPSDEQTHVGGDGKDEVIGLAFVAALGVADPLLSLVGDTLTLPITIPVQNKRTAAAKRDRAAVAAAERADVSLETPQPLDPAGGGPPAPAATKDRPGSE
jgi:hypothetical protein